MDISPDARVIVILVGIGSYEKPAASLTAQGRRQFPPLRYVRKDVERLEQLFTTGPYAAAKFQVVRTTRRGLGAISDELLRIVRRISALPGRCVVLVWSGHAEAPQDDLRLATADSFAPMTAADGLPPTELVNKLAASGAVAALLVLDVCQAAHAAGDISAVAAKRLRDQPPGHDAVPGFAALFSAQPYENAVDGVFVDVLERTLRDGPSLAARQIISDRGWGFWSEHSRLLTPTDLANVLEAEFLALSAERPTVQQPVSVRVRSDFGLFPNPVYSAQAQAATADAVQRRWISPAAAATHFLQKARGLEAGDETGWHFTGRVDVTRRISSWLQDPDAEAMFVLTGDAGMGKSAVIGRTVALSDAGFRQIVSTAGWDASGDAELETLPPMGSIHAAVHLRGLTASKVTEEIFDLLGQPLPEADAGLKDIVARVPTAFDGSRTTLVFDALDEAEDPGLVASEIIRPLAESGCRVLVGTRVSASARGAPRLLEQVTARHAVTYSLSTSQQPSVAGEHIADDVADQDIAEYVDRRLMATSDSPYKDEPGLRRALADEIMRRAQGRFLYARMSVDALLRRPAPAIDRIGEELAGDLDGLLTREVAGLDAQFRDHFRRHDAGASALMSALAWGAGQGVPLRDGLWPLIATSIEEPSEPYTVEHAQWLLSVAGQYVVETGESDQAVYRLYHESLHEYFRAIRSAAAVRRRIAAALLGHVEAVGGWRLANPYLVSYLPSYLDDTDALERLATDASYLSRGLAALGVDGLAAILDSARAGALRLAVDAVAKATRRSRVALRREPAQLATQLFARLSGESDPALRSLVAQLPSIAPAMWLRARHADMGWRAGLETMQTFRGNVRALAFGAVAGTTVLAVGAGTQVTLWEPRSGSGEPFSDDAVRVTALGFGRVDGRDVIAIGAGYHEGLTAVIRDVQDGTAVGDRLDVGPVQSLALGPSSSIEPPTADVYKVPVGADGSLLWWSDSRERIACIAGRPQCITADGGLVVVTDLTDGTTCTFPRLPDADPALHLGMAFDEPVLAQLRRKYPGGEIIVCRADGERVGRPVQIDFSVRCFAVDTAAREVVVAAASEADGPDETVGAYVALRQPIQEETRPWRPVPIELTDPSGIGRIGDHFVGVAGGVPVDVATLETVEATAATPLRIAWGVAGRPPPPAHAPRQRSDWRVLLPREDPGGWPVTAYSYAELDGHVVSVRGSYHGAIWIYDTHTGRFTHGPFADIPAEPYVYYAKGSFDQISVSDVAVGTLGRRVCVVAACGGRPYLYDLRSGKALPTPDTGRSRIVHVAIGSVGRRPRLVTGSDGGAVAVWDTATGVRLAGVTLDDPVSGVWLVDDTVLVRTYDRPFELFDIAEGGGSGRGGSV